jgi:hypothetical protein
MKPALQCRTPVDRRISNPEVVVDLDPRHRVLRITLPSALTDEACREIYQTVARIASLGGPYAAIADLSQVVDFPVSASTVRELAATSTALFGRISAAQGAVPA